MAFNIPEFSFNIYGLMVLLSIAIGFALFCVLLRRNKMPVGLCLGCCIFGIFMGFYGGIMLTYIQNGFAGGLKQIGFSSMGGVIGMLIEAVVMEFATGRKYKVIDSQIRVLPLIYSVAKIGCFLGGCCRGMHYDGPLAITYHGSTDSMFFPVQLTETVVFLLIFILGVTLLRNKHYILIVIISMACKVLLDFLRLSNKGVFGFTQYVCVIVAVGMFVFYLLLERRNGSKT